MHGLISSIIDALDAWNEQVHDGLVVFGNHMWEE